MAFYSIPARGDTGMQEDLNRFLRSHRVLTVHREFVAQGDNSFLGKADKYAEGVLAVAADGGPTSVLAADDTEVRPPELNEKDIGATK